jgi:hypothetical protein
MAQTGTTEVDSSKAPLTAAMAEYVLDFESAKLKRCLHVFNVQNRLDTVRRVSGSMFNLWRSVAGLLILGGLLFTLFNLQRAVGPLGDAFRQLSSQQESVSSSTLHRGIVESGSAKDKVSRIQGTMSDVATSAKRAFLFSFCSILCAALTMCLVLIRQQHASASVAMFAAWAEREYRRELPEQISIAEAAHAFKDNAEALGGLTRSFNDLGLALGAVQNFSRTMDDTRDAIVKALNAMPGQIQDSMGLVTKDMVKNLERTMKDDVESTKQILAIYGQQEFRIDEIRQEVATVRGFTEKVAHIAESLGGIPKQLGAIEISLKQHTVSAQRLDTTAKQIEAAVLAFPSKDLMNSSKALGEAAIQVGRENAQAVEAIKELRRKVAAIVKVDAEIGNRLDTIAAASQKFVSEFHQLKADLSNDQKLANLKLESLTIEAINQVNKLAGKAEIAVLDAQINKVGLSLDSFLGRLRVRARAPEVPVVASRPVTEIEIEPVRLESVGFGPARGEAAVAGAVTSRESETPHMAEHAPTTSTETGAPPEPVDSGVV